ncbi:MAG TPA: hypothetical protein VK665_09990, partial [Candidatus Elarobacter sp.]|nr:hypothetical protein [Candidatus Elarobacter sp.]
MLRVRLFGRPRIALGGVPVSGAARPKVVPLLAYLLLNRTAPIPRRTLASALWPDHADDEARANLRRHLNYVQRYLPPAPPGRPWLLTTAAGVRWNPEAQVELDVAEFERL